MNKTKILIILAAVVLVLAAGFAALCIYSRNHVVESDVVYEPGRLNFCEYSESGDMEGGSYSISIRRIAGEKAELVIRSAASHNSKERVDKAVFPDDVLDKIQNIFDVKDLKSCVSLTKSDEIALDAPSGTWNFVIGEESISFSNELQFTKEMKDALSDIYALMNPEA